MTLIDGPEPPTPTERRKMLVNGAADFMAKYPQPGDGTPEEAVDEAIAKGRVSLGLGDQVAASTLPVSNVLDLAQSATEKPKRDFSLETNGCWRIPRQAQIECSLTADLQTVEIEQEGQHGGPDDDGGRIHVNRGNAVQLAKHILWAAGFQNVGIYTMTPAGNVDLEDGDIAEQIDYDEQPGYGPVRK